MKIALISDLHFGCKKSDKIFLDNQLNYIKNEFIPYLSANNISKICILGDLFDNRSMLKSLMYSEVFKIFETLESSFEIYIFVGNHDTYFKNSIETHSLNFLKKFKNVKFINDIDVIEIFGKSIMFVPWQTNYDNFKAKILNDTNTYDICLAHFDIVGFPFNGNVLCKEGINTTELSNKFKLTFSGHFHKRHTYKILDSEIIMIGSPYQMNRSDKDDDRGFCVLNLENFTYEFINSKNTIKYVEFTYPEEIDPKLICGNIVDVKVVYDGNYTEDKVKKYLEEIEKYSPAYPPNVLINNNLIENDEIEISVKSLNEMFIEYVNNLKINNKDEIINKIDCLYKKTKGEQF